MRSDRPTRLMLARQRRLLAAAVALGAGLAIAVPARGGDFGSVSGTVKDVQGEPLVGATVLVTESSPYNFNRIVHQVLTDAHGRFTVERLLPGHYSLRITSPAHLPASRNALDVEPGGTVRLSLVLGDIFAPFRVQAPERTSVTAAGEDWKWVLRTSASTRPVLRLRPDKRTAERRTVAASQRRAFGLMPGAVHSNPLAGDPGLDSVMAYSRSFSDDADMLVAGSAGGFGGPSLVTAFRRNLADGNPQELALVVHQLNLAQGLPAAAGLPQASPGFIGSLASAQALEASYQQTRRISDSLTLSSGLEVDYLNALGGARAATPRVSLEYHPNTANLLAVKYGSAPVASDSTLLDRVGDLDAFPRVTLRGYRPEIEHARHAEVSFTRRLDKDSTIEVAAYHDNFSDAVVRGFGSAAVWQGLQGYFLPNVAANGLNLDAGNYQWSGVRASASRRLSHNLKATALYAHGNALELGSPAATSVQNVRQAFRSVPSDSVAGKLLAELPATKTVVVASYQWVESGRLTGVDPYGQAGLGIEPCLGIQVRQPLPSPGFFPAHIEAVADVQNLLAQGYVRVAGSGEHPLVLTPAYRSFRGGFSVQF